MRKEPPRLLESTGYLLARVGSESRRRFVEALAKQDLTLAAYGVLMILGEVASSTQRNLGEAVGIDPRNLVPILDDLEDRGLVARVAHPSDRRRNSVRLSASGSKQLGLLGEAGAEVEKDFLQPLSKGERRTLHALLEKLLREN